jgi:hypothetical protein
VDEKRCFETRKIFWPPGTNFIKLFCQNLKLFHENINFLLLASLSKHGILKGKYHCTVDLLFDWFGLVCFANKNKNCQLSYSLIQTSQTGGQWYSDTSPFSIP